DPQHVQFTGAQLALPIRNELIESGVARVFGLVHVAGPRVDHAGLMGEAAHILERLRISFQRSDLEVPAMVWQVAYFFAGDPGAPWCHGTGAVAPGSSQAGPGIQPCTALGIEYQIGRAALGVSGVGDRPVLRVWS